MTREEAAIIVGNILIDGSDQCYSIPEYQEAKTMAIEALTAQPCGDAIDRQALRARFNHLDEVYEGMSEEEEHEAYIYGQIIRAIDDAPPVTPKSLTGHWIDDCPMMTDEGLVRVIRCSHCNEQRKDYYGVSKNYCPKCGVKMEGESE